MKKFFPFILIILISACSKTIEEKDRMVVSYPFTKMMIMNYKAMKESVRSKGKSGDGLVTIDLTGTIEVSKTHIILVYTEESKSKDSELENDTAAIKNCVVKEMGDGFLTYDYKTDLGDFSIGINSSGELYSISYNDWVNDLTFLK